MNPFIRITVDSSIRIYCVHLAHGAIEMKLLCVPGIKAIYFSHQLFHKKDFGLSLSQNQRRGFRFI